MKKLACIVIWLLVISSAAFTQTKIGITGGVNMASGTLEEDYPGSEPDYPLHWGFNAGFVSEINISELFAVQPEVKYTEKGYNIQLENVIDPSVYAAQTQYSMNYLQVPVMAKFRFGNQIKVFVETGPYVGYWLYGKVEFGNQGLGAINDNMDLDPEDDGFNRWDFGMNFGLGLQADAPYGTAIIATRYGLGLATVSHETSTLPNENDLLNRLLSINFTYLIPLTKAED